ncbi:MAG: YdcH family protein [Burkholderiaceae bacterium]
MIDPHDLPRLKRRIIELQVEHRDLDEAVNVLNAQPVLDELQLRRLKKRKLQIKDEITQLRIQIEPDIPA